MIPAFSTFLARRYLLTRPINLLGMLGVAFAVWAMLIVDGVFTGFVQDIRTNVRNSTPPLLLTDLPHDTRYEPLREALESDDDVVATAPRLRHHGVVQPLRRRRFAPTAQASAQLEVDHTENGFALLLGIDPVREATVLGLGEWLERAPRELRRYNRQIVASRVLDEPDDYRRGLLQLPDAVEWQARVDAGLDHEADVADQVSTMPGMLLGWRRIAHTGNVDFGTPFDVLIASFASGDAREPSADTDQLRTYSLRTAFAGFYATGNRMFDETTVLLPIEPLRSALGQDEFDPLRIDLVTDVAIRPRDGMSQTALQALKRRLEDVVQPLLPEPSRRCQVLDWQEQYPVFLKAVAQEQAMMDIVLFVVMLVSAFVIYSTLHMMVVQKVKDIGIVAAVGGAPRGIGAVFLLGGLVVAGTGTALGIGFGLLSAQLLNPVNEWLHENFAVELFPRRLFDLDHVPCHLEPSWVVTVAVFAVLLSLLVAYVPARRASRLDPVRALACE